MADYAKKKNDELANLCKERGLAHTGKKADLVKRLEDHDTQGSTSSDPTAAAKPILEDEIDWDDEPATETAKGATTTPAAAAVAAGGIGEIPNPQAVPNQIPAEDPAQTDDLSVDPPSALEPAEAEMKAEPEKDFSTGIADRTIDEEIEKRKARARKFGMSEDSDEIKALERAKRFGNSDLPGLLNRALPTGLDRKRGGGGGDGGGGGGGVRKRGRGGGRPGMQGRRGSGRRERTPVSGSGGGGASWMSKEDREAAERRRAKFATAS